MSIVESGVGSTDATTGLRARYRNHRYAPPRIEQHDVPWRDFQQITRLVVLFGIAAGCFYLTFILDREHENVPVLWIATVIAECILIFHTLGIWMTLMTHRPDIPEKEEVAVVRRALITGELETPPVDVFITCATEPLDMIMPTLVAAKNMILPHNTWVCDDGRDDDLRDACLKLDIGYLRRTDNRHAKAGNVNSAIDRTSGDYVVVLDADHVPRPDLLVHTLPHMVANPSIAMVQTPQTYTYEGRGMVAEGAAVSQELFYEAIMPAKNQSNSAFCVGTNVVFRRRALASLTERQMTSRERRKAGVSADAPLTDQTTPTLLGEEYPKGGIWVGSNSEDIWTSLELHRRGWRSVFVPKVLTQGLTPETITSFLKQQFRWASGGWEILFWARILRDPRLTLSQKAQYMMVPSHYALSFSVAVFAMMSPIYLITDRSPISTSFWDWVIHYLPFYLLTIAVPFVQAGKFRMSAIIVSLAAAPAHIKAFFATALRQRASWNVTNGGGGGFSIRDLKPHMAIVLLDVFSIAAWYRLGGQNPTSSAIAITFVCTQLGMMVWLLAGSERADRLAREAAKDEPSSEEALKLLDEYLELERACGMAS